MLKVALTTIDTYSVVTPLSLETSYASKAVKTPGPF
jgi:hypothetical protein